MLNPNEIFYRELKPFEDGKPITLKALRSRFIALLSKTMMQQGYKLTHVANNLNMSHQNVKYHRGKQKDFLGIN